VWNPHFFGPERCPEGIINPSSRVRRGVLVVMVRVARGRPRPGIVAYFPNALLHLRASDPARPRFGGTSRVFAFHPSSLVYLRPSDGFEARQDATALRRFVLNRMGGDYLRPSNEPRYAMRLHGYMASL